MSPQTKLLALNWFYSLVIFVVVIQLLSTADEVEKLQEELETMQPLLAQAAEETVETMEKIKVDSVMKTVHVVEYPPLLSPLLLLPRIRMVDNFLFCEKKSSVYHENHYNDFSACYHNTHFSTSFTGAKNIHNAAPVDSTGYYIFELADIFFFQILFCKLPSDFNRLPHVPFT